MSTAGRTEIIRAWRSEIGDARGSFSLVLRSGHREVASLQPDVGHYAASTVKLAVLGALLATVPEGQRDAPVLVHDRFASAAGGEFLLRQADDQDDQTWARLGGAAALMDLAERMITVSSNIAMDLIVERIGVAAVRAFLNRTGVGAQVVLGRLIGDAKAETAGITNTVTAAGLAALLAGIADATALERTDADHALAVLSRQEHRGMIPAGLPAGTPSASKGGWVPGVNHDVALVRPSGAPAYVLAICTTHDLDHIAGQARVARLSAITWEHWMTWHD